MLSGYSDKLLVWWMTNLGSQGIHISQNKKLGFWRSSILLQVIKESVWCFHYYALTELKLLNWSDNLMLDSAFLKLAVITRPSSKEPTVRKVDAVMAMGRGQLLCKFCSLFHCVFAYGGNVYRKVEIQWATAKTVKRCYLHVGSNFIKTSNSFVFKQLPFKLPCADFWTLSYLGLIGFSPLWATV